MTKQVMYDWIMKIQDMSEGELIRFEQKMGLSDLDGKYKNLLEKAVAVRRDTIVVIPVTVVCSEFRGDDYE